MNTSIRHAHALPFARAELESSIPARFRRVLSDDPDHIAIMTLDRRISYRALDAASDRVAHALLAQHKHDAPIIACLLEPGVELIVSILGILKSGKAYTALHLQNPIARLQEITAFAQAQLIVSTTAHAELVAPLLAPDGAMINLDSLSDQDTPFPPLQISADDPAMLAFSSGTTGRPKAVVFTHQTFLHRIWHNIHDYGFTPDDRIAMLGFPGYGGPARAVMNALLSGATLVIIDAQKNSLQELVMQLRTLGVTHIHTGVALIRQLLGVIQSYHELPELRLIVSGGQALLPDDVRLFREKFGEHCTLVHRLSGAECGQVAQYFVPLEGEFENGIVPVGTSTDDKEILLLDEQHQPVLPGAVGEIAVRSRFLAPGYWRDPELTARVFLPDPDGGSQRICLSRDLGRFRPDGLLEHLGRKEQRVRIRGYTVELNAVEAALRTVEKVRQAVVIEDSPRYGENRLVAYIEPLQLPPPSSSALRRTLSAILPDYMIPTLFIPVERMPLLANGKIDRRALPSPSTTRPELASPYLAPRTLYEARLCEIWSQVLDLQTIGVQDTFFDLGGQSLLATQIVTRVLEQFQVNLPLQELFRAPTVAAMARLIVEYQMRQLDAGELDLVLAGAYSNPKSRFEELTSP